MIWKTGVIKVNGGFEKEERLRKLIHEYKSNQPAKYSIFKRTVGNSHKYGLGSLRKTAKEGIPPRGILRETIGHKPYNQPTNQPNEQLLLDWLNTLYSTN